ncbi:MAG: SDR family NAD(P)-dependent oxidoreductase [Pseudomonadota bacterium]
MSIYEDLFSVAGKTALVTGGASGIGRMMAQALVEAGARVLICSRKGDACEAVAAELNALDAPGSAEGFAADLSGEEGVKAAAREVECCCEQLHILCNNAGATWGSSYEEFPRAAWDKVMTLNVAAVFELTRELTPLLQKTSTDADPARIINTASVMGIKPIADGCWSYSTSKAAVIHLTEILANEMASKRITVNALAPGPFPSKMTAFAIGSDEGAAKVGALNPLGRVGRPADIAAATLFLVGHGGSYVSGTTIPLDGGYLVDTGDDGLFAEG